MIYFTGGKETVRACDGGGAFDELEALGEYEFDAMKTLRSFVHNTGVSVDDRGWLVSEPVNYRDVTGVLAHVAQLSVKAAEHLKSKRKPKKIRDLKVEVRKILFENYGKDRIKHEGRIAGDSNKIHKFEYLVTLNGRGSLVVDPVHKDANSINSVIVRHFDLRAMKDPAVRQFIVYDDEEEWTSEDLSLLRAGARPCALSSFDQVLHSQSI